MNTLTFSSTEHPDLFAHEEGRMSGFRFIGLKDDVRQWLIKNTPGAYIRGQNVCVGQACIQFKTPEDAVKFKMFLL